MHSAIFGELTFNTGWKSNTSISLFGKNHDIVVKAKAYFEKDGVTNEQEDAYADFKGNKDVRIRTAEELLNAYANGNATERFVPRALLFNRDGGYALLLDDNEDADGGVAITFSPKEGIFTQDEYL